MVNKVRNWQKVLVDNKANMMKAIEKLDTEALRIVLVVDDFRKLLGTVTDGDVRRALLCHCGMDTPISQIMNRTPVTASIHEDRSEVLRKMKQEDLLHIPIINNEGQIVDLETLQHLTDSKKFDNPVFLMAGGFGKRLMPLTEDIPKPLLKVGNTPILQTILESFISNGFHNFYISTHYKAEMIRNYFGDGSAWDVKIKYVHEEEPLGTAGAVALLPESLSNMPIIMMNGDLLTKVNFENLISFHCEQGGIATMCVREYDFQVPYGVVKADGQQVRNIVEKPIHKFFVNAGIYVIEPDLRANIIRGSSIDMPDLLQKMILEDKGVSMFPVHEYWLDIGRKSDYQQAQCDITSRAFDYSN